MRKLKTILAALLMLCCTTISAHNFEVDGIFYNILSKENKTVEVTYKGGSYTQHTNEYIGSVVIPESVTYNGTTYSVTSIGDAFYNCPGLTSVVIPNSVTYIGYYAFYYCTGLKSVVIGNSVTSIGGPAFYNCSSLTSVEFNAENCKTMGSSNNPVFGNCTALSTVTIGENVKTIPDNAFYNCTGLKSVVIGNSVTSIGNNAFYNCESLTSVVIPNSVTTIGNYAFYFCTGLTSVVIPNSVTTIGNYAFYNCKSLTGVVIPNSVTTIEKETFRSCYSLTSVVIGNSVKTIGDAAFEDCRSLTSIVIPNSVTYIGYYAFRGCSCLTSIVIGNSVTTIGENAFQACSGLTNIVIPNSVTSIGNRAFISCDNLKTVINLSKLTLKKRKTDYGYVAYYADKVINAPNGFIEGDFVWSKYSGENTLVSYIGNATALTLPEDFEDETYVIGENAFSSCSNLTSIEIPNSVTTIGSSAFSSCSSLTSITIPNSVTTIEQSTFSYCSSLTSIVIPNSVRTIGMYAFISCSSLTSITSHIPADKLFAPGNYAFNEIDKNSCTLYVPSGAKYKYATTNGWNEFKNIVELPFTKTFDLKVSAAGYSTLYLDFDALIPEGVEVYTASTVDGNRLMMEQVTGVLPANTGVIVRAEQGTYTFEQSFENAEEIENNLFRGSVEDEYITPEEYTRYYVLAMKDGVVGMYEDALSGGTFKNNAKKAYLALKGKGLGIYDGEVDTENTGAQLSNSYYFDFSGTTAIDAVTECVENVYYDLSGRRVENPTRGVYIFNGNKVLVK